MINQTTNRQKNILTISIAIIIASSIIGGSIIYGFKYFSNPSLPQEAAIREGVKEKSGKKPELKIEESDHIRGNPSAPVTIVEFSDFQCPFCVRFHPTLQQILLDYSNDVRWVYKHFPLDSIHEQARPAAEASECAWEQKGNKGFWQFSDGLFENQSRLGESLYRELAQDLALDMDKFENCFSSRKYKDKVEADYQEGIELGVRGTPGSFINGELISGAVPYGTLKAVVEQAIANQ